MAPSLSYTWTVARGTKLAMSYPPVTTTVCSSSTAQAALYLLFINIIYRCSLSNIRYSQCCIGQIKARDGGVGGVGEQHRGLARSGPGGSAQQPGAGRRLPRHVAGPAFHHVVGEVPGPGEGVAAGPCPNVLYSS